MPVFDPHHSDEDVLKQDSSALTERIHTEPVKLRKKLDFAKSIHGGMHEECAIAPTIQCIPSHFFEEEKASRFEHPPNLGCACLPVHDMMKHPEVKDRFEMPIRKWERFDASLRQNDATGKGVGSPAGVMNGGGGHGGGGGGGHR